ncbi:MAG: SMI1/KNR4 family protein [Planctomycetota bacterium]
MPPSAPRVGSSFSWSEQIAERFQCSLPDDLIDWFDQEIWKRGPEEGPADRFCYPVDAPTLLSGAPEPIWPGLMPNEFLPLVGNEMGDWLCLRFNESSEAGEIVYWYHGGGDWIPWGETLTEALLFDWVRDRLPGNHRSHAIPAISPRGAEAPSASIQRRSAPTPVHAWALERVRPSLGVPIEDMQGVELADQLLRMRLCEAAVRCQLIVDAIGTPETVLESAGIEPREIQSILFDHRLANAAERKLLEAYPQNWDAAKTHAKAMTESSPELAWGWDLLGYAHERDNRESEALEAYTNGLRCSSFTDQAVRLRTHAFTTEGQKFSAQRMILNGWQPRPPDIQAYFKMLQVESASERRQATYRFFDSHARTSRGSDAYELWHRAGWDLGAEPMGVYAELLGCLVSSAVESKRFALGRITEAHRECFRLRYGSR